MFRSFITTMLCALCLNASAEEPDSTTTTPKAQLVDVMFLFQNEDGSAHSLGWRHEDSGYVPPKASCKIVQKSSKTVRGYAIGYYHCVAQEFNQITVDNRPAINVTYDDSGDGRWVSMRLTVGTHKVRLPTIMTLRIGIRDVLNAEFDVDAQLGKFYVVKMRSRATIVTKSARNSVPLLGKFVLVNKKESCDLFDDCYNVIPGAYTVTWSPNNPKAPKVKDCTIKRENGVPTGISDSGLLISFGGDKTCEPGQVLQVFFDAKQNLFLFVKNDIKTPAIEPAQPPEGVILVQSGKEADKVLVPGDTVEVKPGQSYSFEIRATDKAMATAKRKSRMH